MVLETTHVGARFFCRLAVQRSLLGPNAAGLVVGCGSGHEAAYIRATLEVRTTGVDNSLRLSADLESTDGLSFCEADVLSLPFENDSFDFVFYHHVIEHVTDPVRSLEEIGRVLRPGGCMFLGTPNRHRLMGYLGSHNVPISRKLLWNLRDYVARARGRFRNRFGAHAGFTRRELGAVLRSIFFEVEWLASDYLHFKYGKRLPSRLLDLLTHKPVMELCAPAIYALCRKREVLQ